MTDVDDLSPLVNGSRRMFSSHMAAYSGKLVPNSLAAVAECVAAGVPRLEVDVRFLSDDSMLVYHDHLLDRHTTGSGPVAVLDRSAAVALRSLEDPAVGLAFFEEVVDLLRPANAILQVDLKGMRPLSEARVRALREAMAPLGERALLGSQAYWNLRRFDLAPCRLAIDPTLEWHVFASRYEGDGFPPSHRNAFGVWDDAPIGQSEDVSAEEYVATRVDDIRGLVPRASEWMVNIETIRHLSSYGDSLGKILGRHGIELAAWTVRDEGPEVTAPLVNELFALDVTTVITDNPRELAGYVRESQARSNAA